MSGRTGRAFIRAYPSVANIAKTLDGIESAFAEVTMPTLHTDKSDRVEFYKNGGTPPEMPTQVKTERALPFQIVGVSQTNQPDDAA